MRSNQRAARDVVALLVVGEGEPEAAEQEGAFGLAERAFVGSVAVAVAVVGELGGDRVQRGERARVVGRDGAADGGQQQRGVEPRVVG